MTLHRVIADAFLGPRSDGVEVNHRDGDKTHNAVVNLEYVSRSENLLHRVRMGIGVGEGNGAAKLNEATVRAIRARHAEGAGYKRLAAEFHLPWGTVRNVAARKTWQHVP